MAKDIPERKHTFPTAWDVWHWPELIALCKRLGIPSVPHRTLIITIPMDGEVIVNHEYLGQDTGKQPEATE